jgi:flagellar basal-body rod modification protein FlgD
MELGTVSPLVSSGTSANTSSLQQLGEDYTRFLTLLTAQISNQDPLAPMDSTQFVSQLAQLSQVEQSVRTNTQLESLAAKITALTAVAGTDMVGRSVTVASKVLDLESGQSNSFYRLPIAAEKVTAKLVDPLGRVVHTMTELPGKVNENIPLNWNGFDQQGQQMLDGVYTLTMSAEDGAGNPLNVFSFRRTTINEVLFSDGKLYYNVSGDETIASENVLAVR